jgi:hypothetical protein
MPANSQVFFDQLIKTFMFPFLLECSAKGTPQNPALSSASGPRGTNEVDKLIVSSPFSAAGRANAHRDRLRAPPQSKL